ncbi:YibE/F family protein [Treponema primitia ZAS-2]|uniref:YibE/F family protein n=1 Tax=Treponema primitia (strain ATCC BAA-887 / DSM 12427 / ZAS-2) TaxID=545694 RepID=F5YQV5_TREPZ|nr:YibE/F family protein [Treponema primitia]AEF86618.1 YibE/F family protein [Treponema primitia ZAS-2]
MEPGKKNYSSLFFHNAQKKDIVFSCCILLLCVILLFIPTGFENRQATGVEHVEGKVVAVDNSQFREYGLVLSGSQRIDVEVLAGRWKGRILSTGNHFLGKMDLDRVFEIGDRTLLNISTQGDIVAWANAADHYRLRVELILLVIFACFLLFYGGFFGFQAILSFFFTALTVWKLMIPAMLRGIDPIILSFITVSILSAAILFLVAGLNKKGVVALLGATIGLAITSVMALCFTEPFNINGAVRPFSETLLYAGFINLNLTRIFIAGVVLSASGAVMDLSMDISAAMNEIVSLNPDISAKKLFLSGNNIGRSVIGTMTTTLLLAYSGGYLAMLMLFMGQGISNSNILNINYTAAEILQTVVGSFGLVLVAPITTVMGTLLYIPKRKKTKTTVEK